MRALVLSSLLLTACGATKAPAAPAPEATSKPAPKPAREGKSAVFFVVDYEALLPVACYDAHEQEWRNGEPCFELLPDQPRIELEGARVVTAGGFRVPTITDCALTTPLLRFEGAASEKPGTFAVWPEGRRMERVDWETSRRGGRALDDAAKTRLGRAMGKVSPASNVALVQVASFDLDADGAPDSLFSATNVGFDPANGKGIGALLFGRGEGEPVVIRSSERAVFRVEGVLDLDGDGLPEVLASERTFHPNGHKSDAMTVARWTAGGLAPLPPLESCWPPAKVK